MAGRPATMNYVNGHVIIGELWFWLGFGPGVSFSFWLVLHYRLQCGKDSPLNPMKQALGALDTTTMSATENSTSQARRWPAQWDTTTTSTAEDNTSQDQGSPVLCSTHPNFDWYPESKGSCAAAIPVFFLTTGRFIAASPASGRCGQLLISLRRMFPHEVIRVFQISYFVSNFRPDFDPNLAPTWDIIYQNLALECAMVGHEVGSQVGLEIGYMKHPIPHVRPDNSTIPNGFSSLSTLIRVVISVLENEGNSNSTHPQDSRVLLQTAQCEAEHHGHTALSRVLSSLIALNPVNTPVLVQRARDALTKFDHAAYDILTEYLCNCTTLKYEPYEFDATCQVMVEGFPTQPTPQLEIKLRTSFNIIHQHQNRLHADRKPHHIDHIIFWLAVDHGLSVLAHFDEETLAVVSAAPHSFTSSCAVVVLKTRILMAGAELPPDELDALMASTSTSDTTTRWKEGFFVMLMDFLEHTEEVSMSADWNQHRAFETFNFLIGRRFATWYLKNVNTTFLASPTGLFSAIISWDNKAVLESLDDHVARTIVCEALNKCMVILSDNQPGDVMLQNIILQLLVLLNPLPSENITIVPNVLRNGDRFHDFNLHMRINTFIIVNVIVEPSSQKIYAAAISQRISLVHQTLNASFYLRLRLLITYLGCYLRQRRAIATTWIRIRPLLSAARRTQSDHISH
ncbi:hypothetical protein C8R44DRAFT_849957 [Mycena epipterygia]|nr:hypothetical protein C8R44DRAFT_849957 [Mycena epipterygia]